MEGAAKGGHLDLVKFFIEKGAKNWNLGMEGAAIGGHMEFVKFFIEKGARDWNSGMYGAAIGGHVELVEFFASPAICALAAHGASRKVPEIGTREWNGRQLEDIWN